MRFICVMSFTDENDECLVVLIAEHPSLYDSRLKSYKDNAVRDSIWEDIGKKLNKSSDDCRKRWKCIRDSYQRIKRKNKLPSGSSAISKSRKWPLLEKLTFLENVPTERKKICNIELANNPGDIHNRESNEVEKCPHKEEEIDDESNDIEMNNPLTSGAVMTCVSEPKIDETAAEDGIIKERRYIGGVMKKQEHSQNSIMQVAHVTTRQLLTSIAASKQDLDADVEGIKSFCSHIGTILSKLTPALRIEAKTKVFNLLADYEMRNLNLLVPSCASSSSGSPLFDQNIQLVSTNSYYPKSEVLSPSQLDQATFNSPPDISENISCYQSEENDQFSFEKQVFKIEK